jgi:hypothetical protein
MSADLLSFAVLLHQLNRNFAILRLTGNHNFAICGVRDRSDAENGSDHLCRRRWIKPSTRMARPNTFESSRQVHLRRAEADYLRVGIYELRVSFRGINYRILHFFHGRQAILSHGLTKESEVPPGEIDFAIDRKKLEIL